MTSICARRGDLALELVQWDHAFAFSAQIDEQAPAADADDLADARPFAGLLAPVSPGPLGSVGGLRPFPGHVERFRVEPCEGGFHLRLQFGVPLPLERHLGPGLGAGIGHHLLQGVVEGGILVRAGVAAARMEPWARFCYGGRLVNRVGHELLSVFGREQF